MPAPTIQLDPPFRYNPRANRYIDARGRFVPQESVRKAVDGFIEGVRAQAEQHARSFNSGRETLAQYQANMARLLKNEHVAAYAVGRGGLSRLTQSDYGRIGQYLRREYGFLQQLALDVESGRTSPRQFENRSRMFAEGARETFEQTARFSAFETGADEERNLLGNADHCPDCLALAALGWVPIGTLPAPGSGERRCRRNCHCRIETRRSRAQRQADRLSAGFAP